MRHPDRVDRGRANTSVGYGPRVVTCPTVRRLVVPEADWCRGRPGTADCRPARRTRNAPRIPLTRVGPEPHKACAPETRGSRPHEIRLGDRPSHWDTRRAQRKKWSACNQRTCYESDAPEAGCLVSSSSARTSHSAGSCATRSRPVGVYTGFPSGRTRSVPLRKAAMRASACRTYLR